MIQNNKKLLDSDFARGFLIDILNLLEPSLIIVLGKEHCNRIQFLEEGIYLDNPKSLQNFPSAKYQIGYHYRLNSPILGLHFKPSEQFIGLGGGRDMNGLSFGKYATKESLNIMGKEIMTELKKVFQNHPF
ncbi:hypothetical protein [Virgibacillus proomii]|uniref:hypothetical protein n=1 Tax=Virgibacillus proomii TaxID=84407 RepID=UPI001C11CF4C|nr:hypothetical protein [Virgibacillus proomii]MBU5267385.1 hypothetical protein [Virgibacillus proomii]